jgi:pyruvate formate lyase activating enzyme
VAEARHLFGRRMTVTEVIAEAQRDVAFFDESGGGVTLSGGEPLSQPLFAEALLWACRDRRIHSVLDTSGFAEQEVLLRVSRHADLVLYDLKFIDPDKHRDYTGISNELILSNLRALVGSGRLVIIRVPLISGANDSEEEIRELAGLVWGLGLRRIDLLPYHRIGIDKYRRLGITCRVGGLEPAPDANLDRIAAELRERGFAVSIGG